MTPPPPSDSFALASAAGVSRRPMLHDGCFGWLHQGPGGAGAETAVLLCPGLFWEGLQAYHALRLLADALAAAGTPVLRLEYTGTGHSRDLPHGVDPWRHWQNDVNAAADWLSALTGNDRLVLCGLRAGATLAALASRHRADVAGLILIAPVLRGRSYLRQLQVEAQLESHAPPRPDGGLHFYEHAFGPASLAAIAAVDLCTLAPRPGLPIGVFAQAASTPLTACLQAWRLGGAKAECGAFTGLEPMVRQNVQDEGPPPDFTGIVGWLSARLPAASRPAPPPPPPVALRTEHWSETALCFGARRHLFAVLCRPEPRARLTAQADLAVIIVNTGRDPCYGIGRFGVDFARTLAATGIAALRLDFAGLGDSNGPPGAESLLSPLFEQDRGDDLIAAIDTLAGHGFRRFVLHGLCSGAYHALRAAVIEPRVSGLLLINLPLFRWHAGDSVAYIEHKLSSPLKYAGMMLHGGFWRRLLRGEVDVARVVRAQAERLRDKLGRRAGDDGDRGAARRDMAALAGRGVRSLLLFSPADTGLASVEQAFGPGGAELARIGGATIAVVPELDHVLSGAPMRAAAIARMLAFLGEADAKNCERIGQGGDGA